MNLTVNSCTFQTDSKQKMEQIIVPAPPKEGSTVMYSQEQVLHKLAPATAYEATVIAKNKYGSSEKPEKPFKLFTRDGSRRT